MLEVTCVVDRPGVYKLLMVRICMWRHAMTNFRMYGSTPVKWLKSHNAETQVRRGLVELPVAKNPMPLQAAYCGQAQREHLKADMKR